MKLLRKIFTVLSLCFVLLTSSSCAAKMFEEEINVVFMYEEEIIANDTVTQFKNIKSPTLSDAYIPDGYKFFGWTPYDPDEVFATDENFKEKYIGAGKMVHWADVEEHVVNTTVVLKALMIDKADIPVEYHYVVIAWYDKVGTSGLDQDLANKFKDELIAYLRKEGVSEDKIATVVVRGYSGNVGTSCGNIMEDGDVDIMLGWGSLSNVTTTGGMKESMIYDTVTPYVIGDHTARTIHLLTQEEEPLKVYEWLKSDECRKIFAPTE